jgi:hypothetical protein
MHDVAVSSHYFMLPWVLAKRRHDYGSPTEHFEQVARRWSLRLATPVKAEQVVLCLLDLMMPAWCTAPHTGTA